MHEENDNAETRARPEEPDGSGCQPVTKEQADPQTNKHEGHGKRGGDQRGAAKPTDPNQVIANSNIVLAFLAAVSLVTNVFLVIFTNNQARASSDAVAIAKAALADSDENFERDERPWVWATVEPPVRDHGHHRLLATVYVADYGKTPAFRFRQHFFILTNGSFDANASRVGVWFGDPRQIEYLANQVGSMIPPGIPQSVSASPMYWQTTSLPISEPDLKAVTRVDGGAFVIGRILYEDSAKRAYETDVCLYLLGSGALKYCDNYNEMK